MEKKFETIKITLLVIGILSLLWLFISVFFIDVRWWWFIFAPAVITAAIMFIYKKEIWHSPNKLIFRSIAGWLTISTFVFVLVCAIFITPWWWFGLLIAVLLFIFWSSLIDKSQKPLAKVNWQIPLVVSIAFTITFGLFCIPSFVAGKSAIPEKENSDNSNPPEVYILYGCDFGNAIVDREHIYAISWFNRNKKVNDFHNMIWANRDINNQRGNKEFGYTVDKFEPADEYKGDVARAMLYMYVTYRGQEGFSISKVNVNLMKDWARIDPVSLEERRLNELIKTDSIQENSNQFIDAPWLIGFVV